MGFQTEMQLPVFVGYVYVCLLRGAMIGAARWTSRRIHAPCRVDVVLSKTFICDIFVKRIPR